MTMTAPVTKLAMGEQRKSAPLATSEGSPHRFIAVRPAISVCAAADARQKPEAPPLPMASSLRPNTVRR